MAGLTITPAGLAAAVRSGIGSDLLDGHVALPISLHDGGGDNGVLPTPRQHSLRGGGRAAVLQGALSLGRPATGGLDPALVAALAGAQAGPKFYKLEFPTYDGSTDPLNWLNQCEQFFRGQQTLASARTWLASYHLRGVVQTWYYALEQDEGMPPWERFRELCSLSFRPPVLGTRLAELARLPFGSSVQDYSERYNAVLCHAHNLSAHQKVELYVGGLPDHLR
jgi:hypothetical protein